MRIKKLISMAIKWAPVVYPIARKLLNSRKQKNSMNPSYTKNRTFH